jgi:hypothetical protein
MAQTVEFNRSGSMKCTCSGQKTLQKHELILGDMEIFRKAIDRFDDCSAKYRSVRYN